MLRSLIAGCAALLLMGGAATAQQIPRVKAKLLSIDGDMLVLDADASAVKPASLAATTSASSPLAATRSKTGGTAQRPVAAAPQTGKLTLSLMPATLIMAQHPSVRDAIKVGDYVAIAAASGKEGLTAQALTIYPDILRGSNEGRFLEGAVLRLAGQVAALTPAGLTLHYRGKENEGGACMGRAPPMALAVQYCAGDAVIRLDGSVPVELLAAGDRSLLKPGAMVTASVVTLGQGQFATPGVVVERSAGP